MHNKQVTSVHMTSSFTWCQHNRKAGHMSLVKTLVSAGVDVNVRKRRGASPLTLAVIRCVCICICYGCYVKSLEVQIPFLVKICCSLCWKLLEGAQSFVFFWQVGTEWSNAMFAMVNTIKMMGMLLNDVHLQFNKHITKESDGFHTHSTPLTMLKLS